jgi:vesicle coat complex subunit
MDKEILVEGLCKKLAAPLGTLVTGECYENIWAVLRGLQLVVVKYPQIFTDVKIFFVKYNDPSYVKHEKLNMIFAITNDKNYEIVLNELNEYAYDMDLEFNSQAVRCIWKIALRIPMALTKVLSMLNSVVGSVGEGSGQHFIEEVMIGYEQIVRRYPKASNYAENVKLIMQRADSVNKPDAKCSLLFLLGEYYTAIEDGKTFITSYIEK